MGKHRSRCTILILVQTLFAFVSNSQNWRNTQISAVTGMGGRHVGALFHCSECGRWPHPCASSLFSVCGLGCSWWGLRRDCGRFHLFRVTRPVLSVCGGSAGLPCARDMVASLTSELGQVFWGRGDH